MKKVKEIKRNIKKVKKKNKSKGKINKKKRKNKYLLKVSKKNLEKIRNQYLKVSFQDLKALNINKVNQIKKTGKKNQRKVEKSQILLQFPHKNLVLVKLNLPKNLNNKSYSLKMIKRTKEII
jgi:hypothetical protein